MSIERPNATKNTKFISSNYNVNLSDDIINVDTTGGAVNIFLPNIKNSGLNQSPKVFCINDTGGVSGTNPITILGVSGDLINGGVSTIIQKDNGSGVAEICNINEWLISKDTDSATSGIGGGGTTNFIPKFTSSTTIGNSLLHDNGTTVAIGIVGGDASAIFQIDSTTQGFLPPRMNTTQRDLITPAVGLTIFNTSTAQLEFWNGTSWASHTEITLYSGNSTIGSSRIATITDTLTFTGGTTIHTLTAGANAATSGTGTNPIGFGSFGTLNALTTGSAFDEFDGNFISGVTPVWQAQVYASATFVENACAFVGTSVFDVLRPYSALYYTAPNGTTVRGFQADTTGEQLYSQRSGLVTTSLTAADRVLFTDTSGYIRATTYADLATQLGVLPPVPITSGRIPRGTGTTTEDGTWSNVGNAIYPTVTGSNIGQAANRIGTIFMSSVIDYSTAGLTFSSTASGVDYIKIQTEQGVNAKRFIVAPNGYVPLGSSDFTYKAADAGGAIFEGFNGSDGNFVARFYGSGQGVVALGIENNRDVQLATESGITSRSRVTIGTTTVQSNSRLTVRAGGTSVGVPTVVFQDSALAMALQIQNSRTVGIRAMGTTSVTFNVRGQGTTSATIGLQVQKSNGITNFQVRDDGVSLFNNANDNPMGGGSATIMSGDTTVDTGGLKSTIQMVMRHTPTIDGSGRPTLAYYRALKTGAFNSIGLNGFVGEAFNTGTGDFTNASLGVIGILGQARNTGNNTTIQNLFALDANAQSQAVNGSEATITKMGGLRIRLDQTQETNVTSMYHIYTTSPVNTTGANVDTTYGAWLADNTLGTLNNWGLYVLGSARKNIIFGNLALGSQGAGVNKFLITGAGNTSATNGILMQNASLVDYFVVRDNGQIGSYSGGGSAGFLTNVGDYRQSTGFTTSFAWYSRGSSTTRTATFQHTSGGASPIIITAAFQGTASGTVTAIQGNGSPTDAAAPTRTVGVHGLARNGSASSIGVYGSIGGGASVASTYVASVEGFTAYNLDSLSIGGNFISTAGVPANADTKNKIAVQAVASNNTIASGATSVAIAGLFRTSTISGGGAGNGNMALQVPSASNDGTVVFGAASPSVNASFLEVTGDIEILGANSMIWTDRTLGTRYEVYMDNGSLVSAPL